MTVSLDRSSLDASSRPKVGTEGEGAAGGGMVSKCKPASFFFFERVEGKEKKRARAAELKKLLIRKRNTCACTCIEKHANKAMGCLCTA